MPPRTKITREMVVNAAFEVAREVGAENINARTVSEKLGCSTQPVMWQFKTIADMKEAAYQKADSFHTEFLMKIENESIKDIGLNYIRFAATEKNLFRFIFQSGAFSGKDFLELLKGEDFRPILEILAQETQTNIEQTKMIFQTFFFYVHGYASMLANNSIEYDKAEVSANWIFCLKGLSMF